MSLINNYPKHSIEHEAGRIPECLQWLDLGKNSANELKEIMFDDISFKPEILERYGWIGIWAVTDGQMEDEDRYLLADTLAIHGVDKLYATSLHSLERLKQGRFLGACIPAPTATDLHSLNYGWWCTGDWIEKLKSRELLWNTWQEQILFSWPLTFAMVQLCEGYGETAIVGPRTFIEDFLRQSKSINYQWKTWPKSVLG